jgi:hypothetical protein
MKPIKLKVLQIKNNRNNIIFKKNSIKNHKHKLLPKNLTKHKSNKKRNYKHNLNS